MKRAAIVAFVAALPLSLLGCPKKETPAVVDAAPAPTPTPTPVDSQVSLTPLDVDAGPDADAEAGPVKYTGPAVNPNQLRIKQCCNALRTQAKSLGTAPEAAQMQQAAAVCDGVSMAVTSTGAGQAPEFAPVRQMLTGKTLPPLCQGL